MHAHFMYPHFSVRRLGRLLVLVGLVVVFLVWLGYKHWRTARQERLEQAERNRLLQRRECVDRLQ